MPQETGLAIEREAHERLPALLRDLLDDDSLRLNIPSPDSGIDASFADSSGRLWLAEVKSNASPGRIAEAAARLQDAPADEGAIRILVVPYMSPAAAEAASTERVNWIDLAGNASISEEGLRVYVRGRPNPFRSPGRPSSPFAPKSARVTRVMLVDPERWWRQTELAEATRLNDGNVSRIVRRLVDDSLVTKRDREYRPSDPDLLLAAWADDYRFDRHDIVVAHMSGSGVEVTRRLEDELRAAGVQHAFTGLSAAWALDSFARFRMTSVYVGIDPRQVVERLDLRRAQKGGNVQIVGPDDVGVFTGAEEQNGLTSVAPVQAYLDLQGQPERADEAATYLRQHHLRWNGRAT